MKSFAAVATALAATVSAAVPSGPFGIGAYKAQPAGSDAVAFADVTISASVGKFFVNRPTTTYCPTVAGLDCSLYTGTGTTLIQGEGSPTVSLDVSTPGGQQIYVAPDSSLCFTEGHSAALPEGSVLAGFARVASEVDATVALTIEGRTWALCPTSADVSVNGPFQLFAYVSVPATCIAIDVHVTAAVAGKVWQYV